MRLAVTTIALALSASAATAQSGLWMYGITGNGSIVRNELGSSSVQQIMSTPLSIASGLARGSDGTIYGMDGFQGIFHIDPDNQLVLQDIPFSGLEPTGPLPGLTGGLTHDESTNTLYSLRAASGASGAPDSNLYVLAVDLNDNSVSYTRTDQIAFGPDQTISGAAASISLRSDGMLVSAFKMTDGSNTLNAINPLTGDTSHIASLSDIGNRNVSGISQLGTRTFLASTLGNNTQIHEIDLFSGSLSFVSEVDANLFGLVVNPSPSALSALGVMGLIASRRRRT